ncbi:sunset domain-containing protein [Paenarthrobacter nitroguajacolicus]|uniref:sunset domain-containing protein n=1 Tax=Paenarthrobacter nitroguajacolicus TaxID=211146 RepID=UPI0040545A7C
MDWIIWVIVIVLVVAIIWWLMNRNKTRNSIASQVPADDRTAETSGTTPPAATAPSNTASLPDAGVAAAGVAGLAGVTNLGKAAAEGSGPRVDEPDTAEPAATGAAASRPEHGAPLAAGEVQAEAHTVVDDSPAGVASDVQPAATPGLTVAEPVIAAPSVAEPVIDEPVVDEPVVDTDAKVHAADAGDVDDWDAGSPPEAKEPATNNHEADKAEWESSWTDESGAPVHHHEYTDAHSPTLPGAESAAAEDSTGSDDSTGSGHLAVEHPYGTGSSSTPGDAYPVKANASAMTYHDEDTAGYDDAAADVWFESSAHAEAAGFRPPRRSRH